MAEPQQDEMDPEIAEVLAELDSLVLIDEVSMEDDTDG